MSLSKNRPSLSSGDRDIVLSMTARFNFSWQFQGKWKQKTHHISDPHHIVGSTGTLGQSLTYPKPFIQKISFKIIRKNNFVFVILSESLKMLFWDGRNHPRRRSFFWEEIGHPKNKNRIYWLFWICSKEWQIENEWSLFWMNFRIHFIKFKKNLDAKFRVSKEWIPVKPAQNYRF